MKERIKQFIKKIPIYCQLIDLKIWKFGDLEMKGRI